MNPDPAKHREPNFPDSDDHSGKSPVADTDRISELVDELRTLLSDARLYAAAKFDSVRVRWRDALMLLIVRAMAVAFAMIGAVLLLSRLFDGAAGGVAALAGNRAWVGDLFVGAAGLVLLAIACRYNSSQLRSQWLGARLVEYRRRRMRRPRGSMTVSERRAQHAKNDQ